MTTYSKLFSPLKYGSITLKNRIALAPMSVHMTHDGSVTDQEIAYYERRARGGAGLIIVGSVLIKQDGDFGGQLFIDKDDRIPGLKKLVDAVHKHGAMISAQIHHSGRETNERTSGYQPVAPSEIIPESPEYDMPRVLTTKEVGDYVEYYAQGVRRAKEAGFDAVELHCAHGYLIASFMSPLTNKRTDKYGGSFPGRMRFITEIFERARELVGNDYTITVRMVGDELREGGIDMHLSSRIAKYLEELGASAISVSVHMFPFLRTVPNMYFKQGVNVYLAENIKDSVNVPVMTAGRINTPELAESILQKGKADLIGMGRVLICDPDFPIKAETGRAGEIRPCLACNKGCHDRSAEDRYVKCTLNVETGRELHFQMEKTDRQKKVMVIGGGPAGMEAARVAAFRGHDVTLYDSGDTLGGRLLLAGTPYNKEGYTEAARYLKNEIEKQEVPVVLGHQVTLEDVEKEKPDVVILATGASPIIPRIPGVDQEFVVTADDILFNKKQAGKKVVVIGGGAVGAETAHFLVEKEKREVYLVEMLSTIGADMPQDARIIFMDETRPITDLKMMTNTKVTQIGERSVTLEGADGKTEIIDVDTVVVAVGVQPNNSMKETLEKTVKEVYLVGDSDFPKDVVKAVYDGSAIARKI